MQVLLHFLRGRELSVCKTNTIKWTIYTVDNLTLCVSMLAEKGGRGGLGYTTVPGWTLAAIFELPLYDMGDIYAQCMYGVIRKYVTKYPYDMIKVLLVTNCFQNFKN